MEPHGAARRRLVALNDGWARCIPGWGRAAWLAVLRRGLDAGCGSLSRGHREISDNVVFFNQEGQACAVEHGRAKWVQTVATRPGSESALCHNFKAAVKVQRGNCGAQHRTAAAATGGGGGSGKESGSGRGGPGRLDEGVLGNGANKGCLA